MKRPVLVTPPDELPVTLDEVKAQAVVDHDEGDALILGYIQAATAYVERQLVDQVLVTQTWRADDVRETIALADLPRQPAQSMADLTTNDDGTYSVEFVAGYGGPDDVPPEARQAILMLAAYWVDTRAAASDKPPQPVAFAIEHLLGGLRTQYV